MKQQINVSIVTPDIKALHQLKKASVNTETDEITIENTTVETTPGVAETISVLTLVISFVTGVGSQVLASWIYDKLKGTTQQPKFEIYIDGVKVNSETEMNEEVNKVINKKG